MSERREDFVIGEVEGAAHLPLVPDDESPSLRLEDARELRPRRIVVEPMKRLRAGDGVERGVSPSLPNRNAGSVLI
jgi:hypothetical protein